MYELILKEIQTILWLSYLVLVGIGMLFHSYKYDEWGINIFQYGDVLNFLVAPFEDKVILIFFGFSILGTIIFIYIDDLIKKKLPGVYQFINFGMVNKPYFKTYRYTGFAVILIFYLIFSARAYASFAKYKVENSNPITILYGDGTKATGQSIGKTADFIFLLQDGTVKSIPISSFIKEIELTQKD